MSGKLKLYSTTPGSNNSAPPDGWPEGMAPSAVNNSARQMMAQLAEWYRDAEWIDYGDTLLGAAGQIYTISGDVTTRYRVGRAIRQGTDNSKRGIITVSTYSAPNTLVTVSGYVPSAVATIIELGIADRAISRLSAVNSTVDFSAANGNVQVTVNGTQVAVASPAAFAVSPNTAVDLGATGTLVNLNVHNTGTATTATATLTLSSSGTTNNSTLGQINFGSTGLSGTDKRTARIFSAKRDGLTVDPLGDLTFQTANGGVPATRMTISADGSMTLATGPLNTVLGTAIASAASINLDTATGNVLTISGTATISSVTLTSGRTRLVRATGAFTLTQGASLVIVPGLASTTVAAGDFIEFSAISTVVYARVFRVSEPGLLKSNGALSTVGDTTITVPSGTYSRGRLSIYVPPGASADYVPWMQFNNDATGVYTYSSFLWAGGATAHSFATAQTGICLDNRVSLTEADYVFNADIILPKPSLSAASAGFIESQSVNTALDLRGGSGRFFYSPVGALTSIKILLRGTVGTSPTGATVTAPSGGTWELTLEI